jgi:hypothetical protein
MLGMLQFWCRQVSEVFRSFLDVFKEQNFEQGRPDLNVDCILRRVKAGDFEPLVEGCEEDLDFSSFFVKVCY